MAIWLFHPFTNQDQDPVFRNQPAMLERAGMEFTQIASSQLKDIDGSDLLLIAGHGDVGSDKLRLVSSQGNRSMDASTLAVLLAKWGLKKTHESILLLTCFSGGSATSPAGAQGPLSKGEESLPAAAQAVRRPVTSLQITNNKAHECLASILALALGLQGYYSILVGGWPGILSVDKAENPRMGGQYFFRGKEDRNKADLTLAQLDFIQWFDCRGENTASTA